MTDIEPSGRNLPARREGPPSHIDDNGFQIVQGITEVRIVVSVGPHVSRTTISGWDMEAAMKVEWTDPEDSFDLIRKKFLLDRFGSLQFGIRNLRTVRTSTEFTFRSGE